MRSDGAAEVEGAKQHKAKNDGGGRGRGGSGKAKSLSVRFFVFFLFPSRTSFPLRPPAREHRGLSRSRSLAECVADLTISA